ncbi:DUF6640 family protein [Arthrobacter sp. TMS1-12-1]
MTPERGGSPFNGVRDKYREPMTCPPVVSSPAKASGLRGGSAGRKILNFVAGVTAVGGFAADWNRTHLFNPNWSPHAKFHDAQTIAVGSLLGVGGLYVLNRKGPALQRDTALGALLPAFFWASMGAAFGFPGAEGLQSEFPEVVPRVRGVWIDERFGSAVMLGLIAVGYGLDRRSQSGQAPR